MPRLSIVIPPDKDIALLEATLVSVLENRPDDCQITVVLNDVYDDPYDLRGEVRFVQAPVGAGRVTCLNAGIVEGDSPFVHILACGVEVAPGWADEALARFDDPGVAAVAPLLLDRDDPDVVVSAGMSYRAGGAVQLLGRQAARAAVSQYPLAVPAPDTRAAFYRRSALDLVGPLQGKVDDRLAALDVAMTLEHVGLRCATEPQCRVYASASELPRANGFRRALEAERTFWRWAPRAGWPWSLVAHAAVVAGECCTSFPRPAMLAKLAGRTLGSLCFGIGSHRRNHRRVVQLAEQAQAPRHAPGKPHFQRNRQPESLANV